MTIEGTWDLTIATAFGKQHAEVEFEDEGDSSGGVVKSNDEEVPLENLVVEGNHLTWTVTMTKPFRLDLAFDVSIDGDEMAGHSKAGRLPRSKVTGRRVPK